MPTNEPDKNEETFERWQQHLRSQLADAIAAGPDVFSTSGAEEIADRVLAAFYVKPRKVVERSS